MLGYYPEGLVGRVRLLLGSFLLLQFSHGTTIGFASTCRFFQSKKESLPGTLLRGVEAYAAAQVVSWARSQQPNPAIRDRRSSLDRKEEDAIEEKVMEHSAPLLPPEELLALSTEISGCVGCKVCGFLAWLYSPDKML